MQPDYISKLQRDLNVLSQKKDVEKKFMHAARQQAYAGASQASDKDPATAVCAPLHAPRSRAIRAETYAAHATAAAAKAAEVARAVEGGERASHRGRGQKAARRDSSCGGHRGGNYYCWHCDCWRHGYGAGAGTAAATTTAAATATTTVPATIVGATTTYPLDRGVVGHQHALHARHAPDACIGGSGGGE